MVGIIQRDRHIRVSHRFPGLRAGEDDVLHGGSAQLFDLLLAQYPAHSVRNI